MNLKLSRYILPSVISMVLIGTYTNIDGFFIGNVSGDDGLAGINIAWPIVAFITSLGTGIGVGGSALLNTLRGRGDRAAVADVRSAIYLLLTTAGVLTGLLMLPLVKPLLRLMGATDAVLALGVAYAQVICLGSLFQIMGSGLVALLRNEEKTVFSMACCVAGLVVHIALDVLLVEKYALAGVAWSTVLSQAVVMLMALFGLRSVRAGEHRSWKHGLFYLRPVVRHT